MRSVMVLAVVTMLLILSGCDAQRGDSPSTDTARSREGSSNSNSMSVTNPASAPSGGAAGTERSAAEYQPTSIAQDERGANAPPTANIQRRVIRRGEFTIEIDAPADGQRRVAQIAETRGGYVVTSESRQSGDEDASRQSTTATITVRVPSDQFAAAIEDIRGAGGRIRREAITGQDVTEEYTDLEARIRAKRALEAQFMEIMRQSRSITEALQVQQQLGQVRTEIEQMEGRRRLLENQTELSTIVVTLQSPGTLVNTSGFFYNLREAFGDGIEVATAITLGLVRLALALLPVILFIFLPIALLVRYLIRRDRRRRLANQLRAEAQAESRPV